jgi:hypothetical protein
MTEIILTSDQSQLASQATDGLVFCDPAGNVIARVPPMISDEEKSIIADVKQRLASDEPRHTSAEMRSRLGLRKPQ